MFEFFKVVWDIIILRDGTRKGQLNRFVLKGMGFSPSVSGQINRGFSRRGNARTCRLQPQLPVNSLLSE